MKIKLFCCHDLMLELEIKGNSRTNYDNMGLIKMMRLIKQDMLDKIKRDSNLDIILK